MFEKVLIANRGEIALRIHRACREMGIKTVAVHSTADADAMNVRLADESVCIGPPAARDSYLNVAAILSAASITGADAIHPGLGFLAENADFAAAVEEHGFTFIGPAPDHIRLMGDKVAAKAAAVRLGIPTVPGSPGAVRDPAAAQAAADAIGYPILIKAAAGGGGRGMKVARDRAELTRMLPLAAARGRRRFSGAARSISNATSIGRGISRSRSSATARAASSTSASATARCSARTRRCSKRRRRRRSTRTSASRLGALAVGALRELGYRSAGTLEFLYQDGEFFFIEMNTRLQVEHPISEMISGIDIVREQLRIADGAPLGYRQAEIRLSGHAIECRINAENPETFRPRRAGSPITTPRAGSACASTARSIRDTRCRPITTA